MTTIIDQILIPVRRWIIAATGLPRDQVIPADDPGTRPPLPYITIRLLTQGVPAGTAETRRQGTSENVFAPYTGSLQLDAYGPGSASFLSLCDMSLALSKIQEIIRKGDLAIHGTGSINDLSALVDDKIESRHQKDFYIAYSVELSEPDTDAITPLEKVEADFDFSGHEFTVDVPDDD